MYSKYLMISIFYILGIVISKTFDMSYALFLALAVFISGIIQTIAKKQIKWEIFILSVLILFGTVRYFDKTQNKLYYEFPEKYVTVSGTIYSQSTPSESTYKNRYILKLDSVCYLDKTAETNMKILLHTKEDIPFGTKVTASGFLSEIAGINNEYEFDYSLYYKSQGIFARLTAHQIKKTGTSLSLSPSYLAGKVRYASSKSIDRHFSGNSAAFLKAILTGDKSGFSDDYLSSLIKTGIYRILYAPFIHISLIFLIAGFLPLAKQHQNLFVVALVFLYALTNSSSPTIIKAATLCGFFLIRKQLLGFADKSDLISKILLIMTIADPLLCFNTGFLMSVTSSAVIAVSYKPIYSRLLLTQKAYPSKIKRFLCRIAALWLIFLVGTLPISALLFNGISVYAVLFTVVASPLIIFIILASPFMLLSLELFGASPILAPIIGMIIDFIKMLPLWIEKIPAYYIPIKTPKTSDIISFYLLWWVFLRAVRSGFKIKENAVILTVCLGIFLSPVAFYSPDTLSVHFVNVGQGDGAVLHTSRGETILIDGGGAAEFEQSYNIGERVYLPYLISHGLTNIDLAIVSHCHKDHVEGIIAAAENLKINTIVMPAIGQDNPYFEKLCKVAEDKGIDLQFLAAGDKISFKSGLCFNFIAPDKNQAESDDLNDTSLVAHITYGEFSALFTGDSSDEINSTYPENVDILKVAHHGSTNSHTSEEYLERINPEYAVISVGENNSYNLPSNDVLCQLKESGAKVLRTDKIGNIQFEIKKDGRITYKALKGD